MCCFVVVLWILRAHDACRLWLSRLLGGGTVLSYTTSGLCLPFCTEPGRAFSGVVLIGRGGRPLGNRLSCMGRRASCCEQTRAFKWWGVVWLGYRIWTSMLLRKVSVLSYGGLHWGVAALCRHSLHTWCSTLTGECGRVRVVQEWSVRSELWVGGIVMFIMAA